MEKFFNIFQIIMLSLLYFTLTIRSIMLYVKDGTNPFVLGKGKKGFNAILEISFLFALLIWSYEIISHIFRLDFHIIPVDLINNILLDKIILKFIGSAMITAGYIIFILSLIAFGKSWRVGIDRENPGALATGGIFSITRNPIFLFIDMYFAGSAMLNVNLFFILFVLVCLPGIHYQIIQEEKFLKENYGQEYIDYTNTVRRYF